MGYVEQNLISGEEIKYETHLHWVMLLVPGIISGFFFLFALYLFSRAFAHRGSSDATTLLIFAALMIVLGDLPLLTAIIQRRASEFAVTNKRIILKVGVIRRKTAEMFLEKIESVGVDQGILGRIFNYGEITVHGTGGTAEPFDRISHPLEFRRQVQEQIAAFSGRSFSATSTT
jgi:uncharacterized membrane protein YdbT with pleckstrin-like domain